MKSVASENNVQEHYRKKISLLTVTDVKYDQLIELLKSTLPKIFQTMFGTELRYKDHSQIEGFSFSGGVAGLLFFNGRATGMVACVAPEKTACSLVARMTGVHEEKLATSDIADGMGELANMLSGGLKAEDSPLAGVALSPPFSITGRRYTVQWRTDSPTLSLRFEMDGGHIDVLVYY